MKRPEAFYVYHRKADDCGPGGKYYVTKTADIPEDVKLVHVYLYNTTLTKTTKWSQQGGK